MSVPGGSALLCSSTSHTHGTACSRHAVLRGANGLHSLCNEAMLQAMLHPAHGYLLLEWQPQAHPGLLDVQSLKDQLILAPESWQTICCKVLTCLEVRLGTLHQNNYTNKMKFKLFIGSGKVRFLDPLTSLFQSQLQEEK